MTSDPPLPPPPPLPRHVFHLVEQTNWLSIQREGLLCARRLLLRAGGGAAAAVLTRQHRPQPLTLADGTLLRDQRPLPPAALARCLADGLEPADWYALLNARVFFWLDPARLERQARACAPRPQLILTLDATELLARHGSRAALSPVNTGFALRRPARRGAATFVPYAAWQRSAWQSEAAALGGRPRPRTHRPVELTVLDAVPDALELVRAVRPCG